jgi:hypothetical protein
LRIPAVVGITSRPPSYFVARSNILNFSFVTVWNSINFLDDHSAADIQYTVTGISNKTNTKWHHAVFNTAVRNGLSVSLPFIYILSHLREDGKRKMETSLILYYRSTQMFVGVSVCRYIDILHLFGAYYVSLLLTCISWNSVGCAKPLN